uniref:Glycoprotein endo-alpha-1,2-mannosidase n=1 Tax=Timema tahoe TaxID=61484 RepID=A0A7R9FNN1_9NEOP|nr:unnamed protein product [Timema tahoe]
MKKVMFYPIRFCFIFFRRYVSMYIFIIIFFTSAVTLLFYKWAESDKVGCSKNNTPIPSKSVFLSTTAIEINVKPKPINPGELVSRYFSNKTEIRLRWLHKKVEKISEKMNRMQSIKLIQQDIKSNIDVNYNVHIFYYVWYENILLDGHWKHWNHEYLPNWKKEDGKVYPTGTHEPPSDIGSNFYPALGCYSSRDLLIIDTHMKQIKDAKIGVLVASWYPPGMSDSEGEPQETIFLTLLNAAHRYDLKVAPHIEPYRDRNPINFSEHLRYFITRHGDHPALYRMRRGDKDLPVYYVYDSYLIPAGAWKEMLSAKGNLSIRGTQYDGIFLGLLVEMQHRYDIKKAHFDGSFYTYFATNGFTYGSSWKNWRSLGKYSRQNGLLFVPSVGPGYIDTQVRPWNVANIRHRRHGKYYEVAWRSALAAHARVVSITSFNEWHEGTQIEPAIPRVISTFTYLDYEPEGPNFYLNLTRWWVNEFSNKLEK